MCVCGWFHQRSHPFPRSRSPCSSLKSRFEKPRSLVLARATGRAGVSTRHKGRVFSDARSPRARALSFQCLSSLSGLVFSLELSGRGVRIRTDGKKKVVWDWIRITVSQRTQKQQLEGGGRGSQYEFPFRIQSIPQHAGGLETNSYGRMPKPIPRDSRKAPYG